MRTHIILLAICILSTYSSFSQNYAWVTPYGAPSSSNQAYSLSADNSGNIVVGGMYYQTISFGTHTITSGSFDLFLAKFNNTGVPLWVKNATIAASGFTSSVGAEFVCCDHLGNIYIAGNYHEPIVFEGTQLGFEGGTDIFFAKYNPNGVLQWVNSIRAPSLQKVEAITCDPDGNFFVAGAIKGKVPFGADTLVSSANDLFLSKVNPASGQITYTRQIGCKYNSIINEITTDQLGNIYMTGGFSDTLEFNGTLLRAFSGTDIFYAKYSPAGFAWAKHFGGIAGETGNCIKYNGSNGLYLAGTCSDSSMFDSISLTGERNFILKSDTAGRIFWVKPVGKGPLTPLSLSLSGNKKIHLAGAYDGTVDFDSTRFSSVNGNDLFILEADTGGMVAWANVIKDTVPFHSLKLAGTAHDGSNGLYFGGWFNYQATIGSTILTAGSASDVSKIFVGKIVLPPTVGVERLTKNVLLRAMPNPSAGNFILEATGAVAGSQVEMTNALGEKIWEGRMDSNHTTWVDAACANGVYYIRIQNQEQFQRLRVVIVNE